jgi:translation initiation factor IF-2
MTVERNVAKQTKTTRVHQLAKQLGVTSKDVIAKCEAEGIPGITNHMSTVSLGLQATIREWFGESSGGTAVQTAAPVDVATARKKARRKSPKKAETTEAAESKPATTAKKDETEKVEQPTIETVAEEKPATAPRTKKAPPSAEKKVVDTSKTDGAAAPVAKGKPRDEHSLEPAAEAPKVDDSDGDRGEGDDSKKTRHPAMPNVPSRPEVITPAGPRLEQPTKSSLSGPRIIRVENPDVIPPPRARSPRQTGAPVGRGGPRSGRGVGVPGGGTGAIDDLPADASRGGRGASSRRNKRRSGAAGEAPAGRSARPLGGDADRPFNWREQDLLEREHRLNRAGGFFSKARRDNLKRSAGGGQRAVTAAQSGGKVKVAEPITVKNLSAATGVKAADILKKLFLTKKTPYTINSTLETDDAIAVMLDYDIELEIVEQKSAEEQIEEQFEQREMVDERPRSPVVTILGHVDHGKTSLLDRIRNANVAEGEAGGITQATSAFQVPVKVGDETHKVTFIDTPGHEAFTSMRARGAKVTDIVVLVVAADDGVMPQTVESINHAKAAGVPIVVALNKIDKPEATDSNIQRILGQLAEHELNPVEWGGSTEVIRTSATKGEGITDLLEVLDYQAQLMELKADFGGQAQGTVLEASMVEGRGPVASVLIQHGQIKKGDFVVAGHGFGRVRDITDDHGKRIDSAGPSQPVAFSGIDEVPNAGDKFYVAKTLKAAEAAAEERRQAVREKSLATEKITLDNIFRHLADSQKKELPIVLKADVQGSVDTVRESLLKIANEEISVVVKHAAVGGINESDIGLAEASGAIAVGFNVTASAAARRAAEDRSIDIRYYDVIYDLLDDVRKAAEGMLDPELKLEVLGHAEVREVFKISKVGMIAGCYVTDGVIERNALIRVTRDDIVIEKDRKLEQLKRFKDDAKEVRAGQECGMKIAGYDDIKVGDVLECYKTLEVRKTL